MGIEYLDINQNGRLDGNDIPLSGWTVNLTNSSGLVGSALTNASGFFLFDNLSAGRYNISEALQPGYTNTSLATYSVSIGEGRTLNVTSLVGAFGNINLSRIIGIKYLDVNQNKRFDTGDLPQAGWTINLSNSSGLVGSVVTNASGYFLFNNLAAGKYNISEALQSGYLNTTLLAYSVSVSMGKTLNLTSLVGAFGNINLSRLIGVTYFDVNHNKKYDDGDTPLSGWTVNLTNSSGLVSSVSTNASGCFLFDHLFAGRYNITEAVEPGYYNVTAASYSVSLGIGRTLNVTSLVGAFGNAPIPETTAISGLKYLDVDLDGSYSASAGFVTAWGIAGTAPGQFQDPAGIAIDSSGSVYVADTGNDRGQKFTASGTFRGDAGGPGNGSGQFDRLRGMAVNTAGTIYVADTGNNRIQVFTPNADYVTQWGSAGSGPGDFDQPSGIAVDAAGNVYVADTMNNRIQKFDASGTYLLRWGSEGNGNGQFRQPLGVAVDAEGNVYVADTGNERVQKFGPDGTFITRWGSLGSAPGQFNGPAGIATDSQGNVFVSEVNNNRVQKFTPAGTYITRWGSSGSGSGQFNRPEGVAVSAAGFVYVADTGNDRVQQFALDSPLPGWTINLYNSTGALINSTTTDDLGVFTFHYPAAGSYTVAEELRAGCFNTSPASVRVDLLQGQMLNVTDSSGVFGNAFFSRIEGLKFDDANANGQLDPGERGLPGWTINLTQDGMEINATTTDENGHYEFNYVWPGNYTVSETLRPGYYNTTPASVDVTVGQNMAFNVTATFGGFGNVRPGYIEGLKYDDANANGRLDPGEHGLPGWRIDLWQNNTWLGDVITNETGYFEFWGLPPANYTVSEVPQPGFLNTTLMSINVTLAAGTTFNVTDVFGAFGNLPTSRNPAIFGLKYLDSNRNGWFDDGDYPLPDWMITLSNDSGTVAVTTTNWAGAFRFEPLVPGSYTLSEDIQNSYRNISNSTMSVQLLPGQILNVTFAYGLFGNALLSKIYTANYETNTVYVIDTFSDTVKACIPVGVGPSSLAITPDLRRVYVANSGSDNVSVIDTSSRMVIQSIPVESEPSCVAVSPDGSQVYVTNSGSNSVSVIEATTDLVAATIPVGSGPAGVAFRADGRKAYVTNFDDDTVSVIDTVPRTVERVVHVGSKPIGIAARRDEARAYVANSAGNTVSVIDTATDQVIAETPVGRQPTSIAVRPDDARVYVTNYDSDYISVIDTSTGAVSGNVTTHYNNGGVAFRPDGIKAYTVNPWNDSVAIIDTAAQAETGELELQETTNSVTSTPDGRSVFAAVDGIDALSVIDTTSGAVKAVLPVLPGYTPVSAILSPDGFRTYVACEEGMLTVIETDYAHITRNIELSGRPQALAYEPERRRIYVTEPEANVIDVIDAMENRIVDRIQTPGSPGGIALSPDGTRAYVTSAGNQPLTMGAVMVVDTTLDQVVATIPIGLAKRPNSVAVKPDGTRIYVTNGGDDSVSVIDTATDDVVDNISVGAVPCSVAVKPDGTRAYVANSESDSVSVINTTLDEVVTTVPVGDMPVSIAITPDGEEAYVANRAGNSISVISTPASMVTRTVRLKPRPVGIAVG